MNKKTSRGRKTVEMPNRQQKGVPNNMRYRMDITMSDGRELVYEDVVDVKLAGGMLIMVFDGKSLAINTKEVVEFVNTLVIPKIKVVQKRAEDGKLEAEVVEEDDGTD